MANTPTFAVAGKSGSLTFHAGAQDLRLTKFGLHFKSDAIDVTNTRSPAAILGVTNVSTTLISEWLSSVLDIDLAFEGVYTILDSGTVTYNRLLSLTSGTAGMIPGTSSADTYSRASFVLTPDSVHYSGATGQVSGSCVIETFEMDGEVRGEIAFKGTAKVSAIATPGLTVGSVL